jgi:hypothetical protein
MDTQPPQERMLVDHDRSILSSIIAEGSYETMNFSEGPRELHVWTADKGDIERFAGIDLVVLNRDYNSLLLLQYKCMEHEGPRLTKQWRYRPDTAFDVEVARMGHVRELIERRTSTELQMKDLRLHRGALYFKFCKRLPLSEQDGELADGMLMSLSDTEMFLASPMAEGPKGGRYIGYENCERYLNNSLFSALARDGWIGSRGLSDQDYKEVLGFVMEEDDRSLVLAESSTTISPNAPLSSRRVR